MYKYTQILQIVPKKTGAGNVQVFLDIVFSWEYPHRKLDKAWKGNKFEHQIGYLNSLMVITDCLHIEVTYMMYILYILYVYIYTYNKSSRMLSTCQLVTGWHHYIRAI